MVHNPEGISRAPQLALYLHKCEMCGACIKACPEGAHVIESGKHLLLREKCTSCGKCVSVCESAALKLFGKTASAEELLPELIMDKQFYDITGGGVTVSGGEPLLQVDFVCRLGKLLKEKGVSLAIDTSLAVAEENVAKAADIADIFLCDIKAMDKDLHIKLTGQDNSEIISNLLWLDRNNIPVEIRVPVIPCHNEKEIEDIAAFISLLRNVKAVKALSYHDLARSKYEALDMKYTMPDVEPLSKERLKEIQAILDRAVNN